MPTINFYQGPPLDYEDQPESVTQYENLFVSSADNLDYEISIQAAAEILSSAKPPYKFRTVPTDILLASKKLDMTGIDYLISYIKYEDTALAVVIEDCIDGKRRGYVIHPLGEVTSDDINESNDLKKTLGCDEILYSKAGASFQKSARDKRPIHLAAIIIGIVRKNLTYNFKTQTLDSGVEVTHKHYELVTSNQFLKLFTSAYAKVVEKKKKAEVKTENPNPNVPSETKEPPRRSAKPPENKGQPDQKQGPTPPESKTPPGDREPSARRSHLSPRSSFFQEQKGFLSKKQENLVQAKIDKLKLESKKYKKYIKLGALEHLLSSLDKTRQFPDKNLVQTVIRHYNDKGILYSGINSRTKKLFMKLEGMETIGDTEKQEISALITKLKFELDKQTPKRIKVLALEKLLDLNRTKPTMTIKEALDEVRQEFPQAEKGIFRKETKNLLAELENESEAKPENGLR